MIAAEIHAASPGLVSDTRTPQGYPLLIGGRPAKIVDTVGYDDSSGTDVAEETFLKLLSQTRTSLFYPPLVIISDLGAATGAWLKKMISVFPEILIAVRGSAQTFNQAPGQLTSHDIRPLNVFHLPEFLDPGEDEGHSIGKYEEKVAEILEYYAPLNATRDRLDFDSSLFQGQEEEIGTGVETKIEETVVEDLIEREEAIKCSKNETIRIEVGQHKEEHQRPRDPIERRNAAVKTWPLLGYAGWSMLEKVTVWVKEFKDVVYKTDAIEKMPVTYKRRTKQRVKSERTKYEVWRVLCDGTRIFKRHRTDDWRQVDIQDVEITFEPMKPASDESRPSPS